MLRTRTRTFAPRVERLMNRRSLKGSAQARIAGAVFVGIIGLGTCSSAVAEADVADDLCEHSAIVFCGLLPIAPDLEGDIDLTALTPAGSGRGLDETPWRFSGS